STPAPEHQRACERDPPDPEPARAQPAPRAATLLSRPEIRSRTPGYVFSCDIAPGPPVSPVSPAPTARGSRTGISEMEKGMTRLHLVWIATLLGASCGTGFEDRAPMTDEQLQAVSAVNVPGRLEAENYNTGGEGVGYHDTTPGNNGGADRTDDVDIEATTDV